MSTELEAKRVEYKKLRATLSPERREAWRKQEKWYTDPNNPHYHYHKNITPEQWLNSLKAFVTNASWLDAHKAWISYRRMNPSFWGEDYNPFNNIRGYDETTTTQEKTDLLRRQLQSDISLEASFEDWSSDRD